VAVTEGKAKKFLLIKAGQAPSLVKKGEYARTVELSGPTCQLFSNDSRSSRRATVGALVSPLRTELLSTVRARGASRPLRTKRRFPASIARNLRLFPALQRVHNAPELGVERVQKVR